MRSSNRTVPVIPGVLALGLSLLAFGAFANETESETCAMCHEDLVRSFETTIHGRIATFETLDGQVGCSSCHGDATAHVDNDGDPTRILRFGVDEGAGGAGGHDEVEAAGARCTSCHRSEGLHEWQGSTHQLSGVGCTDCHEVHAAHDPDQNTARYSENCMDCHIDVQAQMRYPSHHPVREGHMGCTSCHTPHGSSLGMLIDEERPEETCYRCHGQLQGPFMFEHDPVFEGCDTCHDPHGTVANNLLVQNEPFLCLQCHELHFHAGLEGEETPTGQWYIPGYDPGVTAPGRLDRDTYPDGLLPIPNGESGWRQAFATKCTQCHTEVHGSDSPSQTISGSGRGLMR